MRLFELYEANEKTVGLIFGRFNPPHKGHKAAWEMASKNDEWYVGTNKSTQGPKDPLPYDVKIKAMEAIMPEIAGHIVPHQSWLTLASKIYEDHGKVILRAYTDEKWVTKALVDYNNVPKPAAKRVGYVLVAWFFSPGVPAQPACRRAPQGLPSF